MSGVGSFFSGLSGGLQLGSGLREARQLEKLRDQRIRAGENVETAQRMDWEAEGGDPAALATGGLEDPFLFKLKGMLGKAKTGIRSALGIQPTAQGGFTPSAGASPAYDEAQQAALGMADGGGVDFEKLNREQEANARREIRREKVGNAARKVGDAVREVPGRVRSALSGADEAAGKFLSRAPEGAGRLSRAGAALKRGGALGALGATAFDVAGTDTEDYRKRFGLETDDPSFLGDVGVRMLGAASDLGNNLTLGMAGSAFRDKQDMTSPDAPPVEEPAPEPQPTALPPAGGTGSSVSTRSTSRAAAAPAQRTAVPAAPQEEAPIDFSQMDAQDVPDFKTQDWVAFRENAVKTAILRGVPRADAIEKADQQVVAMQQRGFTNFAMQGMSLQEAGNLKGAMAAYRAAFQYFPSGTDVKFGVQNGRIVGIGVDEKTGKPSGKPMLLDTERVAALIDNFRKPEAWQYWAKDRREFQQKLREYEETDKPFKEATASAALTNAQAAATRSQADLIDAQTTSALGGRGGMKPADYDRAGNFFVEQAQNAAMEAGLDSAAAEKLYAKMSQIYRQTGLDPRMIAERVLAAARGEAATE